MSSEAKNPVSTDLRDEFRDPEWGSSQLSAIRIFKGFTPDELRFIYTHGEIISLKPKAYAVIEGEPSRGLFVILVGTLSVYKSDMTTGAMRRIAYLESGNNFGELSLFDLSPRSASVSAETGCHLFHLDAAVFHDCLSKIGGDAITRFYKACAEELVSRFRNLNNEYISVQQLLWQHTLQLEDSATPAKSSQSAPKKTAA